MRIQYFIVVAFAFSAQSLAVGPPKGDRASGQAIAEQRCIACHTKAGAESIDDNTPLLAGQYADYLEKALREYRSGERNNAIMNLQTQTVQDGDKTRPLTDKEIQDLAAYYGLQNPALTILKNK